MHNSDIKTHNKLVHTLVHTQTGINIIIHVRVHVRVGSLFIACILFIIMAYLLL